jgi:protein ImuB
MMWLCVHFHQLPLDSLWREDDSQPVAVSEHQQIVNCNAAAEQLGVRQGQRIATAYAMCETLRLVERDRVREQEVLQHLAAKLYAFSSQLSVWSPNKILLEVGRSLVLFDGIEHLITSLSATLKSQKLSFSMAIGPTPKAAEVFTGLPIKASLSLWDGRQRQFDRHKCFDLLGTLSIDVLPLTARIKEKFSALGIKRVQQVMTLPESVLSKRFGLDTQRYFRQLFGQEPDVQVSFSPPVNYEKSLDFIDVVHSREALLFPMRRLVDELIEFLRVHQKSTNGLHWILQDSFRVRTEFTVHLSDTCWVLEHCMELVRLRLESVVLTGPIERISLSTEPLTDLQITEQSLWAQSETFNDDTHFVSKIQARLGTNSCYWLSQRNARVPELANRMVNREGMVNEHCYPEAAAKVDDEYSAAHLLQRPSWLLPAPQLIGFDPQKLYWDGKLTLVSPPERIEHQWWQKHIKRDYYVAQHASGVFYWVFYDHLKQRWFVQGVFA